MNISPRFLPQFEPHHNDRFLPHPSIACNHPCLLFVFFYPPPPLPHLQNKQGSLIIIVPYCNCDFGSVRGGALCDLLVLGAYTYVCFIIYAVFDLCDKSPFTPLPFLFICVCVSHRLTRTPRSQQSQQVNCNTDGDKHGRNI